MRNEFVDFLMAKKTRSDFNKLVFMTGDLGFSVVEPLKESLGTRFINAGVAEALMASMAASIASEGYKVYVYSIVPFATLRCLEQIRNDICYHSANVTVVGIGSGFGYGTLGPTHHSTDDLAAMAALPNIEIYNPGDLGEANWAFEQTWERSSPCYLRLSKGGDTHIEKKGPNLIDVVWEVRPGDEATVIVTGTVLPDAVRAVEYFETLGRSVQLLSVPQFKAFPFTQLKSKVRSKRVVVVSEVNAQGGLGGYVASTLACNGLKSFEAVEAEGEFAKTPNSTQKLRSGLGLDQSGIQSAIARALAVD